MNRAERRKLAKSVINRRGRTIFARAKRLGSKAQRQELEALQRGIVAAAANAMHQHGQASATEIRRQFDERLEQERQTPGGIWLPAGVRA